MIYIKHFIITSKKDYLVFLEIPIQYYFYQNKYIPFNICRPFFEYYILVIKKARKKDLLSP